MAVLLAARTWIARRHAGCATWPFTRRAASASKHGPQPLGLSQAAQLPGRDRGRHLLPQAGLRLGPLHLARARPLQGLCLVLGGGLQPRCLRSPAIRLTPLRRINEAANWQSPGLPYA